MKPTRFVVACALFVCAGAFAQTTPVELNLYDFDGDPIGRVLDYRGSNEVVIAFEMGGFEIVALAQDENFSNVGGDYVFFQSADCSGQGYMDWTASQYLGPRAIVGTNSSVYAGPFAAPQTLNTASALPPNGPCTPSVGTSPRMMPVTLLGSLETLYTAPYRLETAPAASHAAESVPGVSPAGLALLAGGLAAAAVFFLRR